MTGNNKVERGKTLENKWGGSVLFKPGISQSCYVER